MILSCFFITVVCCCRLVRTEDLNRVSHKGEQFRMLVYCWLEFLTNIEKFEHPATLLAVKNRKTTTIKKKLPIKNYTNKSLP